MNINHYFLAVNVHALVPCTIALMVGIWWCSAYPWYVAALLWSLSAAVCAALYNDNLKQFCAMGLFFFSGMTLHHRQHSQFATFQEYVGGSTCALRGTIVETQKMEHPRLRHMIKVAVTHLKKETEESWKEYAATVQLYFYKPIAAHVQDVVELSPIRFKTPKKEFAQYLIKEGISATVFPNDLTCTLIKRPAHSFWRSVAARRQRIFASCKKKLSPKTFALFALIFLGSKQINKKRLEHQQLFFKTWGISHHLARSGLHLVLLIMLLELFLNLLPLSFFLKQFLLLILVTVYSLLSWSSISFTRALVTFLLYKLCNFLELPIHFVHIITLVTLLILVCNPSQLFFLDFQLSFGLTFALAWINYLQRHRKLTQL